MVCFFMSKYHSLLQEMMGKFAHILGKILPSLAKNYKTSAVFDGDLESVLRSVQVQSHVSEITKQV